MITKQEVIEYFDQTETAYRDSWHLDKCLALHYGFWEKGVRSLRAALIAENKVLADLLKINSSDSVLDAGCGVGGSSIYLANQTKCKVHGITLSEKQVSFATSAAKKHGVSDMVKFSAKDFHNTGFENESFSVVWFLESFCYSNNPQALLDESYRVLKPQGRIVIADGISNKRNYTEEEETIVKKWLNNWAINNILTVDELVNALDKSGYKNINVYDYTDKVEKSAKRIYILSKIARAYGAIRKSIGKPFSNSISVKNTIGAKYQYLALNRKLWGYYVITADKNE